MRVSSAVGKSERIKTHQRSFYAPIFKRTYNATMGLHRQSPDPQNEAIGTKFLHLVVNTSQRPYERSITNNCTPISLSTKNPHPPVITCLCKFHNYANARPIFMHVKICNFSGLKHSIAYADFTNIPCLHSCMPNHITFQNQSIFQLINISRKPVYILVLFHTNNNLF
ncbi:hypothetical protein M9H77_28464 [Catharanthus roseus]|uniref:Uncharacterized protein n=1 Tax=Catharanthus roseus TaxID=4058 RepID=A0ACC0AJJ5_CATRO|nr:hypothetical protein M9H77_28464 [Catharanthus roseus]